MRMSIVHLLILLLGLSPLSLKSQNSKLEGPLHEFLNSGFMLKFKDMKIEGEAAVRRFKLQAPQIDPENVQRVQAGYEQSAFRFNQLLNNIKADYLNPKKLKYIGDFPGDYQRSLELELHQLSEFYAVHFLQPLADATGEDIDGSPAILLVIELAGLARGLVNHFIQAKQQARRFNEAHLQQHLVQPFRFRTWDEIGPEGSMMPSPAMEPIMPDFFSPPSLDPLLQEATQFMHAQPASDPYQEFGTYDQLLEYDSNPQLLPETMETTPDSLLLQKHLSTQPKTKSAKAKSNQ
jgi:hypothetical protein